MPQKPFYVCYHYAPPRRQDNPKSVPTMLGKLRRSMKRKLSTGQLRKDSKTSSLKTDTVSAPSPETSLPLANSVTIMDPAKLLEQELKHYEDDPAYANKRNKLLNAEARDAWFQRAKSAASPNELKANEIVFRIREHERDDVELFGNLPSEAIPSQTTRDLGGHFLDNRERIQKSRLYSIVRPMPKGAHLHVHFNSEIPPEDIFPLIEKFVPETMFVRTTRPLLDATPGADFDWAEIVFNVMPKDTASSDIYSPDYDPDWKKPNNTAWMRWADFQSRFPDSVQIEDREMPEIQHLSHAQKWARERMLVTRDHAYNTHQTHNGAWACFNQGTRAFKGLLAYGSAYRWYIGRAIDYMIADNIMYTEWRPMLMDKAIPADNGIDQLGHREQMQILCEVVAEKQAALKAAGQLDKFPFGVKIIYCTPRSIPRTRMAVELKDCIALKLAFPDLICGFDLVGAEDRPNSISTYADMLVGFTETCKKLGISIPFFFHAGETLIDTGGSHHPSKSNLYDALLLNAKRIGHGYALTKHPLLVQKYKAQNICLELCPISNELLHLCGNVRQHPFPSLLAAGLHCTLNGDNPTLFRNTLSHEFYQVMVGDTRMNVHGWKQLALWSLEHSCISDSEKKEALAIFKREWDAWCDWVVNEYGAYADGLPELS